MFILYAVVIGLGLGFLLGGRLSGLATIRFHWPWLAILGFGVQLVLFSGPVGALLGPAAPVVYVVSTFLVLVAVARNAAVPGLALVALGAALNLAAIVANGGYMPADPGALAFSGTQVREGYTNSALVESPALQPLTDVYALPEWVPMANVFSIGDVLIGLGVVIVLVVGMRRWRTPTMVVNVERSRP